MAKDPSPKNNLAGSYSEKIYSLQLFCKINSALIRKEPYCDKKFIGLKPSEKLPALKNSVAE